MSQILRICIAIRNVVLGTGVSIILASLLAEDGYHNATLVAKWGTIFLVVHSVIVDLTMLMCTRVEAQLHSSQEQNEKLEKVLDDEMAMYDEDREKWEQERSDLVNRVELYQSLLRNFDGVSMKKE